MVLVIIVFVIVIAIYELTALFLDYRLLSTWTDEMIEGLAEAERLLERAETVEFHDKSNNPVPREEWKRREADQRDLYARARRQFKDTMKAINRGPRRPTQGRTKK